MVGKERRPLDRLIVRGRRCLDALGIVRLAGRLLVEMMGPGESTAIVIAVTTISGEITTNMTAAPTKSATRFMKYPTPLGAEMSSNNVARLVRGSQTSLARRSIKWSGL